MSEDDTQEVTTAGAGLPETLAGTEADPGEGSDPAGRHEEIALAAYYLWLERGGGDGSPEEDWRRAEEQVRRGHAAAAGA